MCECDWKTITIIITIIKTVINGVRWGQLGHYMANTLINKRNAMKKRTYIVSTYNNYEWITTKEAYFKLQLMFIYAYKGYQVYEYPLWFAKLVYRIFNKSIWGNKNCNIELRIPGSDQITYHTPYNDFY